MVSSAKLSTEAVEEKKYEYCTTGRVFTSKFRSSLAALYTDIGSTKIPTIRSARDMLAKKIMNGVLNLFLLFLITVRRTREFPLTVSNESITHTAMVRNDNPDGTKTPWQLLI